METTMTTALREDRARMVAYDVAGLRGEAQAVDLYGRIARAVQGWVRFAPTAPRWAGRARYVVAEADDRAACQAIRQLRAELTPKPRYARTAGTLAELTGTAAPRGQRGFRPPETLR